ncbi:MAG: flagellar hook-associated protein FlgK, partial [Symbiobacteriaceae bacterium]|nr:flagellar hook-associated protein FlgK [Symbiobacteriaceae bacterium]
MRNTFAGLDLARKALATQQYALETTLHNVANANSPGYSRQRVEMGADYPVIVPGYNGIIGSGVRIDAIIRIRDEFLDYQIRNEYSTAFYREYCANVLGRLESFFNEPGEGGLKEAINRFYDSWQNLTRDVTDSSLRAEVRASADVFCSVLNSFDYQMSQLIKDMDAAVLANVNSLNTIATQIAALNGDIYMIEAEGKYIANDLRDRRDLLMDELSKICEIKVIDENNYITVTVNGVRLISHKDTTQLGVSFNAEEGWHELEWIFGPNVRLSMEVLNGSLGAQIHMRHDVQYVYRAAMDAFARDFAMTINWQHRQGWYLDEDGEWEEGIDFFVPSGFDDDEAAFQPNGFSIKVNPLIMDGLLGLQYIAAVGWDIDEEFSPSGPDGQFVGNNINALRIAQIRNNKSLLAEIQEAINDEIEGTWLEERFGLIYLGNTFEEKYHTFLLELGIRADSNFRLYETSSYQTKMLEQRRSSISDVSLDEEMTNMIRFQQAYAAAARLSAALNDVLSILMERVF